MKILLLLLLLPTFVIGQSIDQTDSLDSSFSKPTDLTDKQMEAAKNFNHQGIKDRVIKEGCAKVDNCEDKQGFPIEELISKAYAALGMISGGGGMPSLTKATPKPKPGAAVETAAPAQNAAAGAGQAAGGAEKAAKETTPDYCGMAAIAYEAVGGVIQNGMQQNAQNKSKNINDPQLQSLVNLKETHKARKTTATWQAGVYGAVTTCYVGMVAMGKAAMDFKLMLKLGGAGALTMLYLKKANKHKDAAKKVQAVIDSIPKSGECNPYTGTSCFCKELTSKALYPTEYQEVCVLNNGNFETPKVALGCGAVVEGKVSYDKECKCKASNTCVRSPVKGISANLGFGSNLMNESSKMFDMLNGGEFEEGRLEKYAVDSAARAAKIKAKIDPKTIPNPNLSDEQKKLADALNEFMPAAVANNAAASNSDYRGGISDSAGNSAAIGKLSPEIKEKLAKAISGGYRSNGGGDDSYSEEAGFEGLPGLNQEGPKSGTEVLSFAEQAVSKADVTNSPSTPIFDIISNRYQKSAWKKLDTQGN